jgi:hypothetical protein
MAIGIVESGKAIEQSSEELLRIWRLARASARREVFPGLLDGVLGDFFARSGRLLADGGSPEEVWKGLRGIIRWAPALGAAELTNEWAIAMEVLAAACESFDSDPATAEWLARAVAEAERGTSALLDAQDRAALPPGILTLLTLGDLHPPRRVVREPEE